MMSAASPPVIESSPNPPSITDVIAVLPGMLMLTVSFPRPARIRIVRTPSSDRVETTLPLTVARS